MAASSKETARDILEVVPAVMRTVRAKMRESGALNLSVPKFRTLGFIVRHRGTSLSDVAEHIGLTLPSMSKLIDGLVERKLVVRQSHPNDRRRITLELTGRGRTLWQSARESTQASLAERMSVLSESERATIVRAMRILHPLFTRKRAGDSADTPCKSKS
jgi:DNA-binding MarR family transcriptional regulator